jgi:hypothetical protein
MDFSFFEGAGVVTNAAVVPIIVAIVQLFKMVGNGNFMTKYAPFLSVGAGILVAFLTNFDHMALHETFLAGILYGLSASGLYSGLKSSAHIVKKEENINDNNL